MSQTNPNQIQNQIDRTREDLSSNVNALADKVSPNRIVGRRVRRTKAAVTGVRERVMGASAPATDTVRSTASTAGDAISSAASTTGAAVSSAASTVADATKSAPVAATRQTQGNPIAAGLIAFGVGWLASSLMPASSKEQQIAEQGQGQGCRRSPAARRASAAVCQRGSRQSAPASARGARHGSLHCPGRGQHRDRRGEGRRGRRRRSRKVRHARCRRSNAAINLIPIRSAP